MDYIDFSDLKGKTGVITGGAGVIGSALARGMCHAGINTVILDLDEEKAVKLSENLQKGANVKVKGYKADVLSKESLERVKRRINADFGDIQILINAAGGNSPKATTNVEEIVSEKTDDLKGSFFDLNISGFDFVFDLNFKGTVLPTMVFAKDMIKNNQGAIVNISSMNSFRPLTKIPAYSAAKAAVNNFTQWLAVHFAKTGIRVNSIAPGFFLTAQNRFLLIDEKTNSLKNRGNKILNNTPMGRFGKVEELQGTLLYLVSDVSQFVTGIVIPVDGGYSAYGGV